MDGPSGLPWDEETEGQTHSLIELLSKLERNYEERRDEGKEKKGNGSKEEEAIYIY